MKRFDGRAPDELRPVTLQPGFLQRTPGSVIIGCGDTRVLCTAVLEEKVPPFLEGKNQGWMTAEYAMMPASTPPRRHARETLRPDGRSTEIKRLIGRSLRAAVDLSALGERTIYLDCDVLEADGGTRTASITGAYVALALAQRAWLEAGVLKQPFLRRPVAAVSVGLVKGQPLLDLCYREDSRADVDCNVVMAGDALVEVQASAEGSPFTRAQWDELLDLAIGGIQRLFALQRQALDE